MEWDPAQYLKWGGERSRPFFDLLARVGATRAGLRRGPRLRAGQPDGDAGRPLAGCERHRAGHVRVDDRRGQAAGTPRSELRLGRRLGVGCVAPGRRDRRATRSCSGCPATSTCCPDWSASWPRVGGWPSRCRATSSPPRTPPSPSCVRRPAGAHSVGEGAVRGLAVATPSAYLDRLASTGCDVDVWETTYLHVLAGDDAVLEWVKGTALRPVLSALSPEDADAFLAELAPVLRAAYPRSAYGTVLPFRRIFAVAHRPRPVERPGASACRGWGAWPRGRTARSRPGSPGGRPRRPSSACGRRATTDR